MWKLILGAILVGGAIYSMIAYGSTSVIVFNSIWLLLGIYLLYSYFTTPAPFIPTTGGRRRRY